jgi:peroxin-10
MTDQTDAPDHISDRQAPSSSSYNYPFAAAPDIIRSHQKDAYFQGTLLNHFSSIIRNLYGARFIHTYATEARTFADLLYLGLTTFIGNRTLGEEYCDIIQIEDDTLKLPSISRRTGYILTSILLPYSLNRILPSFRAKLRAKLEANLRRFSHQKRQKSALYKIQSYLLTHLSRITSPSPVHALTLMIFYFTGSYYQLSKRIWGLRYIFTKRIEPSEARAGYEVLGVLLLLQISVQGYLHLNSTLRNESTQTQPLDYGSTSGRCAILDGGVEVSLDPNAYSSNNELLFESSEPLVVSRMNTEKSTHTPTLTEPRYSLKGDNMMGWIKGRQQRKCTLCLEELKDPSATQCGHVFCWTCIGDWVREKPECPLCRRATLVQHILPLRA